MSEPIAGMSVGALRECLINAMDLGGVFGSNLHESKEVLLSVDDQFWPLRKASVRFHEGRLVLVLSDG